MMPTCPMCKNLVLVEVLIDGINFQGIWCIIRVIDALAMALDGASHRP